MLVYHTFAHFEKLYTYIGVEDHHHNQIKYIPKRSCVKTINY